MHRKYACSLASKIKEMNELLFRQAIFHPVTKGFLRWHYWGLIDGAFVGVDTGWISPTKAVENSQRFTGLTDKNKIRIYEGDRLKTDKNVICRVQWCLKLAKWEAVYINRWASYMGKFMYKNLCWASERSEVIGNIYENGDLIK